MSILLTIMEGPYPLQQTHTINLYTLFSSNPGLPKYDSNVFFTFVNNSSTVRTKIGLRKVETKLSVSTTRKFLKKHSSFQLYLVYKLWKLQSWKELYFSKTFYLWKVARLFQPPSTLLFVRTLELLFTKVKKCCNRRLGALLQSKKK